MKVILKDDYPGYQRSLKVLKIESLVDRRERLSLSFAKKCLNHDKFSNMFPKNTSKIRSREVQALRNAFPTKKVK